MRWSGWISPTFATGASGWISKSYSRLSGPSCQPRADTRLQAQVTYCPGCNYINRRPTQTSADDFWHGSRLRRNTQISRQTEEVNYTRMNRWIAQKFNGELLRDKTKPACFCHQELPISPDLSGPHALRGLLCDPPLKRADQNRVIRAFGPI